MRNADMKIEDRRAGRDAGRIDRRELERPEDVSRRAGLSDVGLAVGKAGRRRARSQGRRWADVERRAEFVLNRGAVVLSDVAMVLIESADADVVRKQPVGRCAARFDVEAVVEGRRSEREVADP